MAVVGDASLLLSTVTVNGMYVVPSGARKKLFESHVTAMSLGAASLPAATLSSTVTSVSMSICSAFDRFTSFGLAAPCASSADDPATTLSAAQSATTTLMCFFMPLSRMRGPDKQLTCCQEDCRGPEPVDHRGRSGGKSNNRHAIIAAPHVPARAL